MSHKVGLPPIARGDARILILGSLPGDASLSASQYYAHPRNHFWQLVGDAISIELVAMDYAERVATLQRAQIALWDVVSEADRPGSLDQKIRNAQLNELRAFAGQLPYLRAIAFNGMKAAALALGAFDDLPVDILQLPSSSPAYTISTADKAKAWAMLARYLQPSEHDAKLTI